MNILPFIFRTYIFKYTPVRPQIVSLGSSLHFLTLGPGPLCWIRAYLTSSFSLHPCPSSNLPHVPEKVAIMEEKKTEPVQTTTEPLSAYGDSEIARGSLSRRFVDSFKRDPNARVIGGNSAGADGSGFDVETAAQNTAASPLQRHLKGRHLQMIAIGGSIGMNLPVPRLTSIGSLTLF